MELFAAHGLGGASTHAIAERAGCRQSLVRYHYADKQGLWHATLLHAHGAVSEALGRASQRGGFGHGERVSRLLHELRAVSSEARLLLRHGAGEGPPSSSLPSLDALCAPLGRALPMGAGPDVREGLGAWLWALLGALVLDPRRAGIACSCERAPTHGPACEPLAQWWRSLSSGAGGPYSLAAARRRRAHAAESHVRALPRAHSEEGDAR